MTPSRRSAPVFRVIFHEAYLAEDLAQCSAEGRKVAQEARVALERDGVAADLLVPSHNEHRDGTSLAGMPHLYLPMPYGPWGVVLDAARDRDGLYLLATAFGLRHPDRRPSVYDVAHYRRHGRWPDGMRQTHRR